MSKTRALTTKIAAHRARAANLHQEIDGTSPRQDLVHYVFQKTEEVKQSKKERRKVLQNGQKNEDLLYQLYEDAPRYNSVEAGEVAAKEIKPPSVTVRLQTKNTAGINVNRGRNGKGNGEIYTGL